MSTKDLPAEVEIKPFINDAYDNLATIVAEDPMDPTSRDLEIIEEMAAIGCTPKEIASVLKIPVQIFKSIPQVQDACERGAERVKVSLRRLQIRTAQRNPIMQIFLGKQILGQADKVETKDDSGTWEKAQRQFADKLKNIIDVTPKGSTTRSTKRKAVASSNEVVVDVGEGRTTVASGDVADVAVHGGSGKRKNTKRRGVGKKSG